MQPKQWTVLAAALCMAGLLFVPRAQSADDPTVEVAILLKTLDEAFEKGDAEALRNLMTNDKVAITPFYDGPQSKGQQIKSLSDLKISAYTPGKMTTTVITKDVLLVTYPLTMKGTFKGRELPAKSYVSSLWVNRDGKWKEALYQETIQAGR